MDKYNYCDNALAEIVEEQRRQDAQIVTSGKWVLPGILVNVPIIGFIYFLTKRKAKNENIKNFAKAALVINIVEFLITSMLIGTFFLCSQNMVQVSIPGITSEKKENQNEQEVKKESKKELEKVVPKEKVITSNKKSSTKSKKAKKKESIKAGVKFSDGVAALNLNDSLVTIPINKDALIKNGWTLINENASADDPNVTVSMLSDKSGSTIYLFQSAEIAYKMEILLTGSDTSIGSINEDSDYSKIYKSLSDGATSIDESKYDKTLSSGYVDFHYDQTTVEVTLMSGQLSKVTFGMS